MYDIGIPEIKITNCIEDRIEDTDHLCFRYDAESIAPRPCKCEKCGKHIRLTINDSYIKNLQDINFEGKLVYISLKIRRYRCPFCKAVKPEQFSFYEKHFTITNRLRDELVNRCLNGETFSSIARDYHINHDTVGAAVKSYAKKHQKCFRKKGTPKILGIDEIYIDGCNCLVFIDLKRLRLIDIQKNTDNDSSTLNEFLKSLTRYKCEAVFTNFDLVNDIDKYIRNNRNFKYNTPIIIDRYHAIQEVIQYLDKIRKYIQRRYIENGLDRLEFKDFKYLFLKQTDEVASKNDCKKIKTLIKKFPDLGKIYEAKERFCDIYKTNPASFTDHPFSDWAESVPEWKIMESIIYGVRWREQYLLKYWEFPEADKYSETFHTIYNIIKTRKLVGHNYKFDIFREICFLSINTEQ